MNELAYVALRQRPELKEKAAAWFSGKWGVPEEAYLECMEAYLSGETEYGWYLCLDGGEIVGGLGVIENDFHDRRDLFPNVPRGGGSARARRQPGLSRHGPHGLLRALRLGVLLLRAGRRRGPPDEAVYPPIRRYP